MTDRKDDDLYVPPSGDEEPLDAVQEAMVEAIAQTIARRIREAEARRLREAEEAARARRKAG